MSRAFWLALVSVVAACGGADDATGGPRLRGLGASRRSPDGGTSTVLDGGTVSLADDDEPDSGAPPEGPEESGEATYYNATIGLGACGIKAPADYLVAAINAEQYSKANCGRCASVTGPNGTVVVRVIDKCPGCGVGDLDLSEQAFVKIANKSAGRVKITWHFVGCPS